jgi:hypothetical protein
MEGQMLRSVLLAQSTRVRQAVLEEAKTLSCPRARNLLETYATMQPIMGTQEDLFEALRLQALQYIRELLQLPPLPPTL